MLSQEGGATGHLQTACKKGQCVNKRIVFRISSVNKVVKSVRLGTVVSWVEERLAVLKMPISLILLMFSWHRNLGGWEKEQKNSGFLTLKYSIWQIGGYWPL